MERTRIVHYTHSRTPVILSPTVTSPTTPPRLPSSSSMSSLVSGIDDDKAPLASIDIDLPSTSRRSSKSSDKGSIRSSSTSRLIDDSAIGTSVYTALRCQDLPVPCDDTIDLRKGVNNGETTRKERSRSDVTAPFNGNSPNISMDDAMRRHTLGSWSRSRRKPQTENTNASSSPRNSSTLPHKASDTNSSDTLVKSRRRYTWLSSKQTVPQGPTVTRPNNLDIAINDTPSPTASPNTPEYASSTIPRSHPPIKTPLSPLRQQNGVNGHNYSPDLNNSFETSTLPRTSSIAKASPTNRHNRSLDAHPETRHNSFNGTSSPGLGTTRQHSSKAEPISSKGPEPSPKTSPSMRSPSKQHRRNDEDLVSSTAQARDAPSSPHTEPRSESPSDYNWRRDPRRRPCNFVTDFSLSPPQSPPEPETGTRDPPTMDNGYCEHSPPPATKLHNGITSSPPSKRNEQTHSSKNGTKSSPPTKRAETFFTSKISTLFGSEKCNSMSYSSNSSSNSYVSYGAPDNDLVFEDKTPVNEIDPLPLSQCILDSSNCDDSKISPFNNCKPDNADCGIQSRTSPKKPSNKSQVGYQDCLVRNSLQFVPSSRSVQRENGTEYDKGKFFKSGERKFSYTKKSKSVSVCSAGASDNDFIENVLKSPRTRNSFRIAMGSNWDDVFPATESLPKLPDISEDRTLSPRKGTKTRTTSDEDVFISCGDLTSDGGRDGRIQAGVSSDVSFAHVKKVPLVHNTLIQEGQESEDYDSLSRRIKRNSMRLATASLSDLTCSVDDIDINIDNSIDSSCPAHDSSNQNGTLNETQTSCHPSPLPAKSNLSRTGSLLSSQNSSSFGSFYSCQSIDANSHKNSPLSNGSHRKELRARLDSPLVNRLSTNNSNNLDTSFPSSTRTSSPVSVASSGRSGHRQRPAYYWTRQTPYPRLLYARSSSVSSSRGSGGYRTSSPQPSTTSSIHTNSSQHSNSRKTSNNSNTDTSRTSQHPSEHDQECTSHPHTDNDQSNPKRPTTNSSSRPIDRRSMTLPISNPYFTWSDTSFTPYAPDLSPSSVLESPNSNPVRSPPSLGRPRRKQYAGFDCQPLPMDSFMSDSSSVYTGVSCSSRATDMTGQPDNGQFDESFMSEDIRSCFTDESRGDISFDASETLQPSSLISDITFSKDMEENESKRGSVHSTSTTKQDNGESSLEERSRDDSCSIHNSSDDFIENTANDQLGIRQEKQFGSEYDALFRLYKTDDVFTTPSYSLYSQNGKAFSSSCLLRAQLYSKRKFLSTRDIFDLIKNSDKTRPDATVSLTSLERHAHKVCEAILCCDEMDQGFINSDTHSLV